MCVLDSFVGNKTKQIDWAFGAILVIGIKIFVSLSQFCLYEDVRHWKTVFWQRDGNPLDIRLVKLMSNNSVSHVSCFGGKRRLGTWV